jgi:hypothetical protein
MNVAFFWRDLRGHVKCETPGGSPANNVLHQTNNLSVIQLERLSDDELAMLARVLGKAGPTSTIDVSAARQLGSGGD